MPSARIPARPWALVAVLWLLPTAAAPAPGFPELNLSDAARGAALAGAMVAVPDGAAVAANPAALRVSGELALSLSHSAWIQDQQLDHGTLAGRARGTAWALSAVLLQADDLERRTGPSAAPEGRFGVYQGAVALTAARPLGPGLHLGLTGRLLRQSVATAGATGGALDAGLLYAASPRLSAGVALLHVGTMGKLRAAATDLPVTLRAGLAYQPASPLLLTGEARKVRDAALAFHAGIEYRAHPALVLRLGLLTADIRAATAGLGLQHGRWTVDYAYVPFGAGLGHAHRFSLRTGR